jgi:hypothetical protein
VIPYCFILYKESGFQFLFEPGFQFDALVPSSTTKDFVDSKFSRLELKPTRGNQLFPIVFPL